MDNSDSHELMQTNEKFRLKINEVVSNMTPELLLRIFNSGVKSDDNNATNAEYSAGLEVKDFTEVI